MSPRLEAGRTSEAPPPPVEPSRHTLRTSWRRRSRNSSTLISFSKVFSTMVGAVVDLEKFVAGKTFPLFLFSFLTSQDAF